MNTQVTLTLPTELYEQANRWAAITQRNLPEMLTDVLSTVLTPMRAAPQAEKPVSALSDKDVLALSTAQMKAAQGQRLSALLTRQREGELDEQERAELLALMQVYSQLWIRQSATLAEAGRWGLRKPLEP